MGTLRKTITPTDEQVNWIKAQIHAGHETNDSEYIRGLIRREQERSLKIEAIRSALVEGETRGEPKRSDGAAFKKKCSPHMHEYRLSPAAELDLGEIWTYTVEHWGAAQADRYTDLLIAAFAELAQSPTIAPACDHLRPGYRSRRVERHVNYFRITDYGSAIIRILHERMDTPRHLRDRFALGKRCWTGHLKRHWLR